MASTTWDLAGNPGIDPTKAFLGTTDAEPLVLETNHAERVYIDPQGNVGVGPGFGVANPPRHTLQVEGPLHMDGNPIYLRKDPADHLHGLQWYGGGSTFAGLDLDGPALFGWAGGALGSTRGGEKAALQWNADGKGNVIIAGILDCGGPLRIYDNVVMHDHDLRLRNEGDSAHGIGWYGDGKAWTVEPAGDFGMPGPDGPVVYGFGGGALGALKDGKKVTALRWYSDGSVSVGRLSGSAADLGQLRAGFAKISWELDAPILRSSFVSLLPNFPSKWMNGYSWRYLSNWLWDVPEGVLITNQSFTGPPWVLFHNALDATDDYSLELLHARDGRKGRSGVSHFYFYENGGFEISGAWAAKPGGGEWGSVSDERLKTNVQPLTGALNSLLRLRGVTYEWKEPAKHGELTGTQIGFVGQDVEKVFPEWVSTNREGYKLLAVRGFSALAVEALRELSAICERLGQRLAVLERGDRPC